jgi:hypothetical protein
MNHRLKAVGTAIKLYPLNIVPSLFFLFNINMEKEASYIIEVKKNILMAM